MLFSRLLSSRILRHGFCRSRDDALHFTNTRTALVLPRGQFQYRLLFNRHVSCTFSSTTKSLAAETPYTYSQLLEKMLEVNISQAVRLGIANTYALLNALDLGPTSKYFPTVHVAGTNGKGSVSTKIAKTFELHGLKVGLFTSPHVSSYRERIQINEVLITEQQCLRHVPRILQCAEDMKIPVTFFEITTLLALMHFKEEHCDVVVMEVGLGGRLDSTNVISPLISIITSIALEHTHILGDTIDAIAMEKCGIIKNGVSVVVGHNVPELADLFALQHKGPVIRVTALAVNDKVQDLNDYDDENKNVAITALLELKRLSQLKVKPIYMTEMNISPSLMQVLQSIDVNKGMHAKPPCRFQEFNHTLILPKKDNIGYASMVQVPVILDVAHNPDGLARLRYLLNKRLAIQKATSCDDIGCEISDSNACELHVMVGLAKDKDINECLKLIQSFPFVKHIYLLQASSPRACRGDLLLEHANKLDSKHITYHHVDDGDVASTTLYALDCISSTLLRHQDQEEKIEPLLLACGSFFIMRDVKSILGIPQPMDVFDLNERSLQPPPLAQDADVAFAVDIPVNK